MKLIFGLYLLLFVLPGAFAQKLKEPPPLGSKPLSAHYVFGKKYNLSFSKRMQVYPFNHTAQIQLVSFDYGGGQIIDTVYFNPAMPKLHYAICRFPFPENKTLTIKEIEELSDILLNYGYIKAPQIEELTKCYAPRNGILFLDKNGKVFEFIEICFGCRGFATSVKNFRERELFDRPKYDLVKKFFEKVGIAYGVTKEFDGTMLRH